MGVKKYIRLKKFMQIEGDLKCMQTNFGGHGFSGFEDFAPFLFAFKTAKFSLSTMDYSPWGSKNKFDSKNSCR